MTDGAGCSSTRGGRSRGREHGYCVDDVARGLVVVSREPHPTPAVLRLGRHYLSFVLDAVDADGACRNRMSAGGDWLDVPALGDWWGRALWGLGTAAARAETAGPARPSARRLPACRSAQVAVRPVDGVRRARRRRGAARQTRASGPLANCSATAWPAPVDAPARRDRPGLAVARAASALRQRHRGRGAAGRRRAAAGRRAGAPRPDAARVPAPGRDPRRSPVGDAGRRPWPDRHRSRLRPAADRGRRDRGRLRDGVPGHRRPALADRHRAVLALVQRRQRRRGADVRPRDRRRVRRPARARPQPQPGRRVDPRAAVHAQHARRVQATR